MADTNTLITPQANDPLASLPWWKGAVIYQIYPRSFYDTNGDGIGDLRGIVEKLDHIASLGVDGIWISPFFKSPMRDYGYDVADFCDVDPIFGTLDDFDAIIGKAHRLGLKVIIDQVYSHTSDEHDWFKESRASRGNPKTDWYVWADPKADGSPPSNWQSVFGGPSWEWDARRGQYYLHNFLKEQPDLNLHNLDVQDAVIAAGKFWMDRGVDGFRLDALNFSMHNLSLADNPPSGMSAQDATRPFDMQIHKNNMSQPEIPAFIERFAAMLDAYPGSFTVAEVGGPSPIGEMKAFTESEKRLDSAYNFDFLYAPDLTPQRIKDSVNQWDQSAAEGWPSWAFSNHDAPRCITRWAPHDQFDDYARMIMMLLLSLRGNPIIYQGEELALPQANVAYEHLKDPEAIINWPKTLGRDGARTPMPWSAGKLNAGFSDGEAWLPVDPAHTARAVDKQNSANDSMMRFTRACLSKRKLHVALVAGSMKLIDTQDDTALMFMREMSGKKVACAFNLGPNQLRLPDDLQGSLILASRPEAADAQTHQSIPSYSGLWIEIEP